MTEVPQHMEALMLANSMRFGRARFKRGVGQMSRRDGFLALADELREANWGNGVGSMPLSSFLQTIRRVGPSAVPRIMSSAAIAGWRVNSRVDQLTEREREALGRALERRATA